MILGGKYKFLLFFYLVPAIANADVLPLDDALRVTYTACVGIDESLSDLKKMAGINTAVTAVGTAAGAGATVVGIVKANKDSKAEDIEKLVQAISEISDEEEEPTKEEVDKFLKEFEISYQEALKNREKYKETFTNLRDESKTLGNWRTGLMAGNTATNIAGAIIAGNNKVDEDLQTQINDCKAAVKNLRDSMMQARMDGKDITEANNIVNICNEYNYVDVSSINDRANGAMISSIVGVATGVAGTVTSAVANSEDIRKDKKKFDKTDKEWDTEKNWNTAANVLAGTSTVASGVATVFNATQISAIKKVASVAEKCTGVLK